MPSVTLLDLVDLFVHKEDAAGKYGLLSNHYVNAHMEYIQACNTYADEMKIDLFKVYDAVVTAAWQSD